jgi:hypothetical protein
MMRRLIESTKNISAESIWKLALTLVGWVLMGVWMTAKISAGYEETRRDMQDLKRSIEHVTYRLDGHIDQTEKKGK